MMYCDIIGYIFICKFIEFPALVVQIQIKASIIRLPEILIHISIKQCQNFGNFFLNNKYKISEYVMSPS